MIRLAAVDLLLARLPLVTPFRTSFGEEREKEAILVRIETEDGAIGWGECGASPAPRYSPEFNKSAWLVLRDHLAPALIAAGRFEPEDAAEALSWARGNRMAKSALEMAVLDAAARSDGTSLARRLGAVRDRVACGVSIGIPGSVEELIERVGAFLAAGYVRAKLKIAPGWDVDPVRAVRDAFPDAALSVDANAAYRLEDRKVFEAIDGAGLTMIEQPLGDEDLLDHARLQAGLSTPVCLDESIRSAADAAAAIELGACRVINVKASRVGGLLEAVRVHDVAREAGVPVWCGGMLETGIGRAANLALAALPGFTLPGDTSASERYFADDLTKPFVLDADGTMAVPDGPGLGVEPRPDRLDACTVRVERITA